MSSFIFKSVSGGNQQTHQDHEHEQTQWNRVKVIKKERRHGDLAKIIASNIKLKKFVKWKPKYNDIKLLIRIKCKI